MVFQEAVILFVGLAVLVKGADFFVEAAASFAKKMGVSEFIIGLTLVAFGTSIPELASSIAASIEGAGGLVTGNIIGSNMANIGLIVGIAALIAAIKSNDEMVERDGYIMLFSAVVFFLLLFDGVLTWADGVIMLVFYGAYIFYLLDKETKVQNLKGFMKYFFRFKYLGTLRGVFDKEDKNETKANSGFAKDVAFMILGGALIIVGAKYMVEEAVFFSNLFGIPEVVIGVSIIAVGTSLPELMVTYSAARKGFGNIAVGNVIGSNIANVLLIGGVASLFNPISVLKTTLWYLVPLLILFSGLFVFMLRNEGGLKKSEGTMLLAGYAVFLAISFII